jgi:hypothetical protein
MIHDHRPFGQNNATRLDFEAATFSRRKSLERLTAQSFVVFDFEYEYDTDRYEAYRRADQVDSEYKCKWPYHHAVAGAWAMITYLPRAIQPIIHNVTVLDASTHDEIAIVGRFFELLDSCPQAVPVGWGTEVKELPTLRRTAATQGLVLPRQLRDTHPHTRDRIDLCNAVKGQGHFVHMPEYAQAVDIPAKFIASKAIGLAVEHRDWPEVREQVLADVLTTAIIANRHILSMGRVGGDVHHSDAAIFASLAAACPWSLFLTLRNRGWDEHRRGQSRQIRGCQHDPAGFPAARNGSYTVFPDQNG